VAHHANLDFATLWQRVSGQFALPAGSVHGPAHWQRVERNGLFLARRTAARLDVVRLFAVLHDSQRINEYSDPGHGQRAADFARKLRGDGFEIDDEGFLLLYEACAGHTDLRRSPDSTIGTCLDADRLDLWRVSITPSPHFMSTEFGHWLASRGNLRFLFTVDQDNPANKGTI